MWCSLSLPLCFLSLQRLHILSLQQHAAHRYNPTCSAPRLQLPEKLSTIVTFFERLTDQLIARLVQSIEKYGSTAFQITELSGTIKQRCRQVRSEPAQSHAMQRLQPHRTPHLRRECRSASQRFRALRHGYKSGSGTCRARSCPSSRRTWCDRPSDIAR